jgi:tRNA A-37 threonylcarbamoyl transferase component Bud32
MSGSDLQPARVLELAEEFLQRYRQGERPPLKEYLDRHPELAAEIRQVFPAMAVLENIALADESLRGEGPAPPAAPAAPPGQLGDYRIIRRVGQGGMGIVYEAEQVSLGRHVALKVLPRKVLLDARQRRRFEREARAAARLHHTNIVPVFGVGEHDGMPYYVMQFIQGRGLDEVLDELRRMQGAKPAGGSSRRAGAARTRTDVSAADVARSLLTGDFDHGPGGDPGLTADAPRPAPPGAPGAAGPPGTEAAGRRAGATAASSSSVVLPGHTRSGSTARRRKSTYWHSVAQIGVQVAEALEHAHGQGVLHRDIKPSNLPLDLRGTVWVTDFGLAKADDQQNLTHTGDILGTLRYMPPEAFEGQAGRRGDVYSLGLTLYELLALRPAFDEADRNRLVKLVTTGEPPRLARLNAAVPRDLVTVVEKAMDRDPAHRYASAADLALDLQRFLDDEPIRARRAGVRERCWRWCRRNPALALATGLAAAALLAVTAVSSWLAVAQARFAAGQARSNEELRREQVRTAEALRESNRLASELDARLLELRKSSAWSAVDRAQGLVAQGQPHRGLLWLTRGLELAPADDATLQDTVRTNLAGLRGDLALLRAASACPYPILAAAWSPDGRTVALAGGDARGEVRLYESATGRPAGFPLPHPGLVFSVAFSPDGKTLRTAERSAVRFWDVATRAESGPPLEPQVMIVAAAFSPDGKTVALAEGGNGQTRLWDVAARKPVGPPLEQHRAGAVYAVAFGPDGTSPATAVALGDGRGECRVWDAATGKPLTWPCRTPRGSWPSPSARTARRSRPAGAATPRPGCGTPPAASRRGRPWSTRARSGPWTSAPTAGRWPPPAAGSCASGTPTPAG